MTTMESLDVNTADPLGGEEASNNTSPGEEMTFDQLYAMMGILALFAITGTVGNALALYVFGTMKQKLTSTIFILALAGTDFITCLVTVPSTIAMEYTDFKVKFDFVCKVYHFLITTTIPFSAFVMVAIAVDRYLCICHPFMHLMTIRRAQVIVGCLALFCFSLGAIVCIHYSVYSLRNSTFTDHETDHVTPMTEMGLEYSPFYVSGPAMQNISYVHSKASLASDVITNVTANATGLSSNVTSGGAFDGSPIQVLVYTGSCTTDVDVINRKFFSWLTKIYSGFFLLSCIIVLVLYSLIYRSVIVQRRRRLKIQNTRCCLMLDPTMVDSEQSEVTVALELSQVNGERQKGRNNSTTEHAPRPSHHASVMSRSRIDRMRMANIKTALMLFVVALVFIVAFLPAWLMAHRVLKMNILVFNTYFVYNVANPIIYAFMNKMFKKELANIFKCQGSSSKSK